MRKKIIKGQGGVPLGLNTSSTANMWNTSNLINQQKQQLQTPTIQPQILNTNPNLYTVQSVSESSGLGNDVYSSTTIGKINAKKGGIKNALGSKGTSIAGGLVAGMYDAVPTADKVVNSNDQMGADIRGTANKALLSGAAGPWGMVAGAANMLIDKTGGFTDASQGLGKGTDTANMIASLAIPGAGWFAKKTQNYKMSDSLKQSSGYTGTAATGTTAQQNAGAKLLFGRRKANRMIGEQKRKDNMVQDIMSDAQDDFAASNNPLAYNRMQMSRSGGFQATAIGKKGIKLFSREQLDFAKNIIAARNGTKLENTKKVETRDTASILDLISKSSAEFVTRLKDANRKSIQDWENPDNIATHKLSWATADDKTLVFPMVQDINGELYDFSDPKYKHEKFDALENAIKTKNYVEFPNSDDADWFTKNYKNLKTFPKFKDGGKVNVIPEGELHARKHNMDIEGITPKGIPVVVEKADGGVVQQAEIEKNEIIFNLEVTKKLEKLMKEDTDEAAIEAGKLLVQEILHNTEDRTGLLNEVE